jgi:hypothetical protein
LTTDDQRDHLTIAQLPIARDKLRKWIKSQEDAIEQVRTLASKALEAGDRAQSLATLQLATRTQAELIALATPKKAAPGKSRAAVELQSAVSRLGERRGRARPCEVECEVVK